jgi:hypothetical protein
MRGEGVKVLTLHQPYATAIALGHKRYETRSWWTSYRGPIAIHAAKALPGYARDFAALEHQLGRLPEKLPLGAIVAVARVSGVRATDEVALEVGALERLYGDYSPGRFAWRLEDVRPLREPYPLRGRQGLSNLSEREERLILEDLLPPLEVQR